MVSTGPGRGAAAGEIIVAVPVELVDLCGKQSEFRVTSQRVNPPRQQDEIRAGKLLEQGAMVTTEDLQAALADQVRSLFGRLFADAGSWFAFYEGLPAFPSRHVRLDLVDLLVKCARAHEQG